MSDDAFQPWPEVCIGELGDLRTSSVDKLTSPSETAVRLINYMDVYRNRFIDSTLDLQQVTASVSERSAYQVKKGDVLFTPSSETPDDICHAAAVTEDLPETLHSYHTVRLRLNTPSATDVRFLAQLLNAEDAKAHLTKRATGSTRYTLKLGDFRSMEVALPPVEEQRRIAEVLDHIDETIAATEHIISKLQEVSAGLIDELASSRFGAKGDRLPLGEMLQLQMDYRGRTPKKLGMNWGGGQIRALSANNVQMGGIDFDRECYLGSPDLYRRWMTKGPTRQGDLLVTLEAPLGNISRIPDHAEYILSQRVVLLRFDPAVLLNDFAYWLLRSRAFQGELRTRSTGTTATGIRRAELERIFLPMIDLDEQRSACSALGAHEASLEAERKSLRKLRETRAGLALDLLSGRVRAVAA